MAIGTDASYFCGFVVEQKKACYIHQQSSSLHEHYHGYQCPFWWGQYIVKDHKVNGRRGGRKRYGGSFNNKHLEKE